MRSIRSRASLSGVEAPDFGPGSGFFRIRENCDLHKFRPLGPANSTISASYTKSILKHALVKSGPNLARISDVVNTFVKEPIQ